MTKLQRVLVAVDFSAPARTAFDHALALGRLHDAELTVVHAVPTDRPFKWDGRERRDLMSALRAAAKAAAVRLKISVQAGDPAGVILLHANARRADVIVLGTSERSGLDRVRFGSVAETVALGATQPVLVVPASVRSADSMTPFKNIVVAVDFSDRSRDAVERALSMANGDSRVTVVHVVRGVPPGYGSRRLSQRMEAEYQRHRVRDAWGRIPETIPATARQSRDVRARVVAGDPSIEISRVAEEVDADLVLVGVTPRSALGRLLFGSTAARVIRTAGRAVLAVPRRRGKLVAGESNSERLATAA